MDWLSLAPQQRWQKLVEEELRDAFDTQLLLLSSLYLVKLEESVLLFVLIPNTAVLSDVIAKETCTWCLHVRGSGLSGSKIIILFLRVNIRRFDR